MVATIKTKLDLSVIVTAHREGPLIYRSLRSIYRSRLFAEARGLKIEVLVILNSADAITVDYVQRAKRPFELTRIITKDLGPVGPARNFGARVARADIVTVCDGDDLYSENWLYESYQLAKGDRRGIWHPQYLVAFDGTRYFTRFYNQSDPRLDQRELLFNHFWSAVITTNRQNLLDTLTPTTPAGSGFAYEDWAFNLSAIAAGCHHRVVPQTARFYRSNWTGNTTKLSLIDRAVTPPNDFYTSRFFPTTALEPTTRPNRPLWRLAKTIHRLTVRPWFDRSPKPVRQRLTALTINIKRRLRIPLKPGELSFGDVKVIRPTRLPRWLIVEAQNQSEIEPTLFTTSQERWPRRQSEQLRHPGVSVFSELLALWPRRNFTHVWLMPRLSFGGAEHSAIELINSLVQNFDAQVLIILTEPVAAQWRGRLKPGVVVLELGSHLHELNRQEQSLVLFRLLTQKRPGSLVVLNDALGWRLVSRYTKALAGLMKIFTVDYLCWHDEAGRKNGYGRNLLPSCIEYVSRVITDSDYHRDYLRHYLGCQPSKIVSLPIPYGAERSNIKPAFYNEHSPNVLWAARLDKQKRLDLLIAIAQRLPDYTFYVYGQPVLDKSGAVRRQLQRLPNVRLMGLFNNILETNTRDYLCFLHTAEIEGIPITLLLMMLVKLPVVASAVGGVPEIINRQTGFLIDPYEDVNQYVAAIKQLAADPADAKKRLAAAYRYVTKQHSRDNLKAQLAKLPDLVG